MNSRLCRWLGSLFAAGALAGCAMPSSQTGAGNGPVISSHSSPVAYGEAAPAPPTEPKSKLADAAPIDESIPDVSGFKQTGRASWYGKYFNGRRTANGERYDMQALTAAHKTLPLASYVRVTNMANQKSVIVRINDRGPYVRGRVIDLSYAAARALGLHRLGLGRVEIVGLSQQEATEAEHEQLVALANASKDGQ
jgi:rare lipoprotein A